MVNLSARESEILSFLTNGFTDKEIAESLNLSVRTVHTYNSRIFLKCGVKNRTAAVSAYLRRSGANV